MTRNAVIEILKSLVQLHSDRVARYERSAHASVALEPDLRNLFLYMVAESKSCIAELYLELTRLGGHPSWSQGVKAGILYQLREEHQRRYAENSTESLLKLCETKEDAAIQSYGKAMELKEAFPEEVHATLVRQQHGLQASHDLIRCYRGAQRVSSG